MPNKLEIHQKTLFERDSIQWKNVTCPKCGEKCVMPYNKGLGSRIHTVKMNGSKCGGSLK